MVAGMPSRARVIGDRLRVVAGRHGDDAARALGRRQRGELVERAALLERIGDLQVLVFDEDLGAGERRKLRRRQHRRAQHMAGDGRAGRAWMSASVTSNSGLLSRTLIQIAAACQLIASNCDADAPCNGGLFCPHPWQRPGLTESWPPANPTASACRSSSSPTPTIRRQTRNCSRACWRGAWSPS